MSVLKDSSVVSESLVELIAMFKGLVFPSSAGATETQALMAAL